jgi:hypothetical protein
MANMPDDDLIGAYLDGELSGAELARAEHLLATQPESRQLLEELTTLRTSLQSLPRQSLGEDFASTVLRRAEREMLQPAAATAEAQAPRGYDEFHRPVLSWKRWQRPLAWSALAIAAALLIMAFSPEERKVAVAPAPPDGQLNAAGPRAAMVAKADRAPAAMEQALPKSTNAEPGQPQPLGALPAAASVPRQSDNSLSLSSSNAGKLLVVECEIAAGADAEATLRQLLAEHKIGWEDAQSGKQSETVAASERSSQANDRLARRSARRIAPSPAISPDAVYAVASPEQLRAAIESLDVNDAFRNVTFQEIDTPIDASRTDFGNPPAASAKATPTGTQNAAPRAAGGGKPESKSKPSATVAQAGQAPAPLAGQQSGGRAIRAPLDVIAARLGLPDALRDKILSGAFAASPPPDDSSKSDPGQRNESGAAATAGKAGVPSASRVLFIFRVVPESRSDN